MAPKGRSAVCSRVRVQQAVDELSAAANDLTQQQSGKIEELIDYLKTGIPTIPACGDLLRSTPVLSVLLSVVTARMQRQYLRQQELPLFWEVGIGLTQCMGVGKASQWCISASLAASRPWSSSWSLQAFCQRWRRLLPA
ncbi:hypothetical protein OEZ85_008251 [Tetradesmus obliquus]|uniref:Uncharacterized protein n=1 Tax=Tetradesmus obliquus TaxID=3088 RepID=A0ABY8TIB3_TETOB|nr:hypothetical protein OEZ85_008251 [Tetradesmus obliquus]